MFIEGEVRRIAAFVFLWREARQDLASMSVPVRETVFCAAAALLADAGCLFFGTPGAPGPGELGGSLLLAAFLLALSAHPSGMIGTGDGLVFLALGLLTGLLPCLRILFGAAVLFIAGNLPRVIGGRIRTDTKIPFLPFCAAAAAAEAVLFFVSR